MSGALPVVITGGREGIQESMRTQNRIWSRARVCMVRRANSGSRESGNAAYVRATEHSVHAGKNPLSNCPAHAGRHGALWE
jgi:ribonuclease PH